MRKDPVSECWIYGVSIGRVADNRFRGRDVEVVIRTRMEQIVPANVKSRCPRCQGKIAIPRITGDNATRNTSSLVVQSTIRMVVSLKDDEDIVVVFDWVGRMSDTNRMRVIVRH